MATPEISMEMASEIAAGTIYTRWWFYVIWIVVTAVGAACGVWLREKARGDITKEVWLAQESWKEKYRLYTVLVQACEDIAGALWQIHCDTRVLRQMDIREQSTEADALRLFPEHKEYLDIESAANERLVAADVGVELMLREEAKAAVQRIKRANTRSSYVVNLSYWQRVRERCTAASEAKQMLIEAAKKDLRI